MSDIHSYLRVILGHRWEGGGAVMGLVSVVGKEEDALLLTSITMIALKLYHTFLDDKYIYMCMRRILIFV